MFNDNPLPVLRFKPEECFQILKISRPLFYRRVAAGAIKTQQDGALTFVSLEELQRYVRSLESSAPAVVPVPKRRGRRKSEVVSAT